MKNKKLIISSVIVAVVAFGATFYFYSQKSEEDLASSVIAKYNGGEVTLGRAQVELNKIAIQDEKLKGVKFSDLTSEQKEIIIKEIILKEIAYKEAKSRGLDQDADYQEALKIFESELLKQKLFIALAQEAGAEENVKENYEKLAKEMEGQKDLRIRYIALKTQGQADSLYKILAKNPNSFARYAKRRSIDRDMAKKGGDLGFVVETSLPKEVAEEAKKIKKGEVSKPFQLANRWVIIKLEDERPAEIVKFDDAKANLSQSLSLKAIQDFISNSIDEAEIKVMLK